MTTMRKTAKRTGTTKKTTPNDTFSGDVGMLSPGRCIVCMNWEADLRAHSG